MRQACIKLQSIVVILPSLPLLIAAGVWPLLEHDANTAIRPKLIVIRVQSIVLLEGYSEARTPVRGDVLNVYVASHESTQVFLIAFHEGAKATGALCWAVMSLCLRRTPRVAHHA